MSFAGPLIQIQGQCKLSDRELSALIGISREALGLARTDRSGLSRYQTEKVERFLQISKTVFSRKWHFDALKHFTHYARGRNLKTGVIVKFLGASERTLQNYLSQLVPCGYVESIGRGVYRFNESVPLEITVRELRARQKSIKNDEAARVVERFSSRLVRGFRDIDKRIDGLERLVKKVLAGDPSPVRDDGLDLANAVSALKEHVCPEIMAEKRIRTDFNRVLKMANRFKNAYR